MRGARLFSLGALALLVAPTLGFSQPLSCSSGRENRELVYSKALAAFPEFGDEAIIKLHRNDVNFWASGFECSEHALLVRVSFSSPNGYFLVDVQDSRLSVVRSELGRAGELKETVIIVCSPTIPSEVEFSIEGGL